VITAIGGVEVDAPQGFDFRFATKEPGSEVDVQYVRGGKSADAQVAVAVAPGAGPDETAQIIGNTRFAGTTISRLTPPVAQELNLPFESAEQAKKGEVVDGVTVEEVRTVINAMTENLLLEIQKTFDFYKASASTDRIDRIILSGGACAVDGFSAALHERFGCPVEMFDPFKTIAFDAAKLDVEARERLAPMAAVAVGLALRKVGDR